jgi:hypothetical protein
LIKVNELKGFKPQHFAVLRCQYGTQLKTAVPHDKGKANVAVIPKKTAMS